jgi:hypothetical protein
MDFFYLLSFDLWISYLEMIFFLIMQGYSATYFLEFSCSIKIFNGQQYSFQVWQEFHNIPKFFFIRIIYLSYIHNKRRAEVFNDKLHLG